MAIENFTEVQDYIKENLEKDENVKNYIRGFITSDRVETFLQSEEGKKLLQPKLDSYFNKGLKSWQDNNLQKLVQEKYDKEHPNQDPKDKAMADLKAEIEKMKNETLHKDLTNKALKVAQEKKLPTDLIDYFIGQDETTTTENLEKLEKVFSAQVESVVQERLKGGYQPPKDEKGGKSFTMDDLKKMTPDEINANWTEIQNSLGKK